MTTAHKVLGLLLIAALRAQATPPPTPPTAALGPEGAWLGTLGAGSGQLRLGLKLTKSSDGVYLGTLTSIDQGNAKIPLGLTTVTAGKIHLDIPLIKGSYDAVLSADGQQLKGTWLQGATPQPLDFSRSAADVVKDAAPAAPTARNPFGLSVEMQIEATPTPFMAGDKTNIVYEIHITNFSRGELLLSRLEVLSGDTVVAAWDGAALAGVLQRPGVDVDDKRALGAGLRAIAWVWVSLDKGAAVPQALRHRLSVGDQAVEGAAVAIQKAVLPAFGAPLRGENWSAANGPSNTSPHRRAMIPLMGRTPIAQRFAIDWQQLDASGTSAFKGDEADNTSYFCYGAEVLAVADAVVASSKDGIPDNVPGLSSRAVPITLETVGGNYLILDLGKGRFAFYGHLQPGSLRVKKGDKVHKGQVLGLLGNSGNSTGPHLHFHVSDANAPLVAEGQPYALSSYEVYVDGAWHKRTNQLPIEDARVRFVNVK